MLVSMMLVSWADLPSSVAGCTILDLNVGAINLDLLGLVVNVAPIAIDITAYRGPSNLLGNLLCAVAGLLNPGSGLGNLLNNLLSVLNNILGGL